MKWAIVNGSPKGSKGATEILINVLLEGACISGDNAERLYAAQTNRRTEIVESIEKSDGVLVAFPLYTDTMPGQLQALFEALEDNKQRLSGKPAWFAVHSGFPETCQAKAVERLLSSMCPAIGLSYMGTIRAGGAGLLIRAIKKEKSRRGKAVHQVLCDMSQGKPFTKEALDRATGFDMIPGWARILIRMLPVQNIMFSIMIRKNKANCKDRPYA